MLEHDLWHPLIPPKKCEVNSMSDYGKSTLEWPYQVNYGKENNVKSDILILGGGVAGCHGAISAAKRGAKS